MAHSKTIRPTLLLTLLLLLNGCASLPQAANRLDQITVTQLDHNLMRVDYRGKSASEAIDLTLLRAAEAALQQGYHYFVIIDPNNPLPKLDGSQPVGLQASALHNGQRYALAEPSVSNTIVCFRQKPRDFAYVALFVKASLRTRYGLDRGAAAI